MFVRQSTHDKLRRELYDTQVQANYNTVKYNILLKEYNDLVRQINEKGGQAFLKHGSIYGRQPEVKTVKQFTDEELKQLLRLVHPDKHNGRDVATKMFQKIQGLM